MRSDTIPKVSCCMIVKNEERLVKGCLASVVREVDEVIFVDTGSEDNTLDIARSFGNKVKIFNFPWNNNFSDARNFSLSRASGDWIIYLDADERLNTMGFRNVLRQLAQNPNADAYTCQIRNLSLQDDGFFKNSIGYAVRFFKNMPGISFEGAIHEQIIPSLKRCKARILGAPFVIDHLGYHQDPKNWQKKLERNLKISLEEIKKNPDDALQLYHLAITWYLMGNKEKAWQALEKAQKSLKDFKNYQISCGIFNMKAKMLLEQNRYEEAIRLADRSLEILKEQNSAHLIKGLALYFLGKYREAIPFAEKALKYHELMGNPFKHPSKLSHEFTISPGELKKMLANSYYKTGNYLKALDIIKSEITNNPEDVELLRFAGMCAYKAGLWDSAEEFLVKLINTKSIDKQILIILLDLFKKHILNEDFSRIISILEAISRTDRWIELSEPFMNLLEKSKTMDRVFQICSQGNSLRLIILFYIKKGLWNKILPCTKTLMDRGDKEAARLHMVIARRLGLNSEVEYAMQKVTSSV